MIKKMEEKERKRKSKSNDCSGSNKKTKHGPQTKEENTSEELNYLVISKLAFVSTPI